MLARIGPIISARRFRRAEIAWRTHSRVTSGAAAAFNGRCTGAVAFRQGRPWLHGVVTAAFFLGGINWRVGATRKAFANFRERDAVLRERALEFFRHAALPVASITGNRYSLCPPERIDICVKPPLRV
jgi:hypothetical protein